MKRIGLVLLSATMWACGGGGEEQPKPAATGEAAEAAPSASAEAEGAPPPSAAAKKADKGRKDDNASPPPLVSFTESDFVESDESRDPFRDYMALFKKPLEDLNKESGRKVKAATYSLDELKLTGIVITANSRAMLVDPSGFGWILFTGDFVGKAELVSTGGAEGQEVPLNWKVDRIRAEDIVFVREDPSHPQIARTTRVIPLYPAGDVSRRGS